MPTSQRLASSNPEILRSPATRRSSEMLGAASQQIFWTSSPFCPLSGHSRPPRFLPTTDPTGSEAQGCWGSPPPSRRNATSDTTARSQSDARFAIV
jgi:hypothetical protein